MGNTRRWYFIYRYLGCGLEADILQMIPAQGREMENMFSVPNRFVLFCFALVLNKIALV